MQPSSKKSEAGRCHFHEEWSGRKGSPDRYYHEKVAKGTVVPTFSWMTEHEERALLKGRYRGDGRRLDHWVTDAPPIDRGEW